MNTSTILVLWTFVIGTGEVNETLLPMPNIETCLQTGNEIEELIQLNQPTPSNSECRQRQTVAFNTGLKFETRMLNPY
jgi:hypothetical protein